MSHEPPPIKLDYATPIAQMSRNPQAEALILEGNLGRRYTKLFSSTKEAATFYSQFQSSRFTADRVDGVCKQCGAATRDLAMLTWTHAFQLRTLEFSVDTNAIIVGFATIHSLCAGCVAHILARIRQMRRNWMLGFGLAAIGMGTMIWAAFGPAWAVTLRERSGNSFLWLPAAVAIGGIALTWRGESRWARSVPTALRPLRLGTFAGIYVLPNIEVIQSAQIVSQTVPF